jgi:DNA-binding winged helix-turn-helix (wHTH) protein/Ni2+-binding GTPase involved in maturation of urease and hydrogenase
MMTGAGGAQVEPFVPENSRRLHDRVAALTWGRFRLDLREERLFKEGREVPLRTKPLSILRYLACHPRRLVARDELVEAVWGRIAMSESLVRTHMWELRRVLGENVVETVVGRGYRFAADVEVTMLSSRPTERANGFVGRTMEMGALCKAFQEVTTGRQLVAFVSGEPGVGKSTLVDAFLDQASAESPISVVRCDCRGPGGDAPPLQPLLEALATVCRGAPPSRSLGNSALELLSRHAPTVAAQMLLELGGRSEADDACGSPTSTTAKVLLELTEGIEALGKVSPVVLVVDELQLADPATIDLLASLGQRRNPSRVLVVATIRTGALTQAQRLTRMIGELLAHGRAVSIALAGFDERTVAEYLATRFGVHRFPAALATTVHAMTGGNPRSIASLFDDLDKDGFLRRDDEGEGIAHNSFGLAHDVIRHVATATSTGVVQQSR